MLALGLEYEKVHVCPNDFILYRKEYENFFEYPTCDCHDERKKKWLQVYFQPKFYSIFH